MKLYYPTILAALLFSTSAAADDSKTKIGIQADIGAPDGASLGLTVKPKFDWLRLNASATYNGFAPGVRLGATWDPISFVIAPTLTVEGGWTSRGSVPYVQNAPELGYTYLNLHLGLEVGNRSNWRIYLHAGPTWFDAHASNVTNWLNENNRSITLDNISATGILLPTAKLGFVKYF